MPMCKLICHIISLKSEELPASREDLLPVMVAEEKVVTKIGARDTSRKLHFYLFLTTSIQEHFCLTISVLFLKVAFFLTMLS